jgi:DNA-binding response OmpR family regulator
MGQANSAERGTTRRRHDGALLGRLAIVHERRAGALVVDLAERLRREAFSPIPRAVSRALIDQITADDPDAVVIVYRGTGFDLLRLCRDLRSVIDCGIVVACVDETTTGPAWETFATEVLDAGADQVVAISSPAHVLGSVIRVAIRARPKRHRRPLRTTVGDVVIDEDAHLVQIAGHQVNVRALQFQVLLLLARNAGSAVSREQLLGEVWGLTPADADPRRLRITISGLRRILGSGPERPTIESIAKFGYRLTHPAIA